MLPKTYFADCLESEQILSDVEQIATASVINILEIDEAELAVKVLAGEIKLPT